jgi:vacuolar-type H+-ATPase subunit H
MSFHPPFGRDASPGCSIKMSDKILKADALPEKLLGSTPKVLKREAYEASREAHDVVSVAQEKARQILQDAEREGEAIREQARQDGYTEGLSKWNEILAGTSQKAEELTKAWEDTMLKLSVRVAEKIIGEQLKLQPDIIVSIIKEVLAGRPLRQAPDHPGQRGRRSPVPLPCRSACERLWASATRLRSSRPPPYRAAVASLRAN